MLLLLMFLLQFRIFICIVIVVYRVVGFGFVVWVEREFCCSLEIFFWIGFVDDVVNYVIQVDGKGYGLLV